MIYACLKFLQEWHSPLTLVNFLLLGTASGLTLAVPLAGVLWPLLMPQFAGRLALAASRRRAAWLARMTLAGAQRAAAAAIHDCRAPSASITRASCRRRRASWAARFNTREFFHGRPRAGGARGALGVPARRVPVLPLAADRLARLIARRAFVLAFAVQFAGLLAERWYFFAAGAASAESLLSGHLLTRPARSE